MSDCRCRTRARAGRRARRASPRSPGGSRARSRRRRWRRRWRGCAGGWRPPGLETRSDALGNLAGRRGAPARALLIGSHLDSVADAGRYDGILGVLVGLAVVEALDATCPLEVVAFADEEGLRFQSHVPRQPRRSSGALDAARAGPARPDGDHARRRARRTARASRCIEGAARVLRGPHRAGAGARGRGRAARRRHRDRRPDALQPRLRGPRRARRDDADGPAPRRARPRPPSSCSRPSALAHDEPGLVATVGELGIPHGACNVIPGRVERDARHPPPGRRASARARSPPCSARPRRSARAAASRSSWSPIARARRDAVHARARRARSPRRSPRSDVAVRELPERRRARCGDDGRA